MFRSNKHISAQVIDDIAGVTLASASTTESALRATQIERKNVMPDKKGGAGAGAKSSSCSSCTTAQSANDPNELRDARADCDTVARLSMSEYSAVVSSHDDTIVEAVPGFAGAGAPSTSSKSGALAGKGAGASANNGSQVPSRFRRRSFAARALFRT